MIRNDRRRAGIAPRALIQAVGPGSACTISSESCRSMGHGTKLLVGVALGTACLLLRRRRVEAATTAIEGARGTRRRKNPRKTQKNQVLGVFSPWDPENRVRGEILHILVVGELRGMVLKRFYETCAKIVFAKYSLHLQY